MPSYRELLTEIRKGSTAEEMLEKFDLRPSQWRRMLNGKRFQAELEIAESIAAVLAVHQISSGVHDALDRFTDLLASQRPETVRKVCLALLTEGLQNAQRRSKNPKPAQRRAPHPWEMPKSSRPTPVQRETDR